MTDSGALEELAALHGVQTSFTAADGTSRRADEDVVLAVLRALEVPVEGPADVPDAIRSERLRRHLEVLEPVVTTPAGRPPAVDVSLPRGVHPRDCWLSIEGEHLEGRRTRLMPAIRRPLRTEAVDGQRVDRYELSLASLSAEALEPGYYRLALEGPALAASALLLASPRCPRPARGWGIFLPLHAVRTGSDWGTGSYPDLADLAAWTTELGGDFVGTLPLYPAFLGGGSEPVESSPYLPVSRLGWNELYVDPAALPEVEIASQTRALLGSAAFADELDTARRSLRVDYPAAMARVRRALEPMARALLGAPSARRNELEAFARRRPDMVAYARFRADGPDAPRSGDTSLEGMGEEAAYHLYAQWAAEQQIAAVGNRLYLDLPVGVHPAGFDPWWEPGSFASGVQGGAPPDAFFSTGQAWGFRPLHPEGLRLDGYRYPIACLRHVMRQAAAVRIDHVMGLHRLYWVPDGADAQHGAYVRYRERELRAVVALEAHRSGTAVVGEDLGTVPPGVRAAMEEDRMLRSWVMQFEASGDDPLPSPPDGVMASLATHDLPKFAAFWDGYDIGDRQDEAERSRRAGWRHAVTALMAASWSPDRPSGSGGWGTLQALRLCLDHLAASPARLMVVDLEDLWLERQPQNRPGSGPEAGNWQHRASRTLEELEEDPAIAAILTEINRLRERR